MKNISILNLQHPPIPAGVEAHYGIPFIRSTIDVSFAALMLSGGNIRQKNFRSFTLCPDIGMNTKPQFSAILQLNNVQNQILMTGFLIGLI
jgi:hypothetical protein